MAILYTAIIIDVVQDPYTFNPAPYRLSGISQDFRKARPQTVTSKAANTILARIIAPKGTAGIVFAQPFFQSHIKMPIKPGERVWLLKDDSEGEYYYVSRAISPPTIEDVNFTDWTREGFDIGPFGALAQEIADGLGNILPGSFNPLLDYYDARGASYENTITSANTSHLTIVEPVPKYTSRPGDLVLQGSSNTLICLGQEGGWTKEDTDLAEMPSISSLTPRPFSGTIDLVTGRGSLFPAKFLTKETSTAELPSLLGERTAPRLAQQELTEEHPQFDSPPVETDKNPKMNQPGTYRAAVEGDPDFAYDNSRIYISSQCAVDSRFSLFYPNMLQILDSSASPNPAYAQSGDAGAQPPQSVYGDRFENKDFDPIIAGPTIAIKSNEIRIISRFLDAEKELNTEITKKAIDKEVVKGSIRLVKEGLYDDDGHSKIDGTGQATVTLLGDGTVFIDGARIVLGTGRESDSWENSDHVIIGQGAKEPMVLGEQLKAALIFIIDEMNNICTAMAAHTHPVPTGNSGPTADQISAFSAEIPTALSEIEGNLDSILSLVGKLK